MMCVLKHDSRHTLSTHGDEHSDGHKFGNAAAEEEES